MNLDTVEAFFIVPLIQYLEKEPKDGFREHTIKKLSGFDAETLNAAVEWVKSNRQAATSFPSPKEAIAAVNAVLAIARDSVAVEKFDASGATYGAKLTNWLKAHPKRSETIKKGSHEWAEWEIYFRATENKVQWPEMERREVWTVPTLTPSEFDPNYDWAKGRRLAEDSRRTVNIGGVDRAQFVKRMLDNVRFGQKPMTEKPASEAERLAAEWKEKVHERFEPVGDMKSRLGL